MSYEAARIVVRSAQMSLDHVLMSAAMRRDFNEVVAVRKFSNELFDRIGDIKSIGDAEVALLDLRRKAGELSKSSDPHLAPVYLEIDALLTEQIAVLHLATENPDQLVMDEADADHHESVAVDAPHHEGTIASMAFDAANSGLDLVVRQAALRVNSSSDLNEAVDWVDRARQSIAMQYLNLSSNEKLTPDDAREEMLAAIGVPTGKKSVNTPIPDFVRAAGIGNLIPRGFERTRRIDADNGRQNSSADLLIQR